MKMRNWMLAAAGVLGLAGPLSAGRIEGQVFDREGRGVEGLVVSYRTATAGEDPQGRQTGHARTNGEGVFVLADLAGGQYSLCVQASLEKLVTSSCGWGAPPFLVAVGASESRGGVQMLAAAGRLVDVRVEDPKRLLEKTERGGKEKDLVVGVTGPDGFFRPLPLRSGDRYGWNHQLMVPEEMEVRLHVLATEVRLVDAARAEHQSRSEKALLKKKAKKGEAERLQFWVEEKGK